MIRVKWCYFKYTISKINEGGLFIVHKKELMLSRTYDILCAGELLVDLISEGFEDGSQEAETFRRLPGGSPANLCGNMARLGHKALLAASIGRDSLGNYLENYVNKLGVDTRLVFQVDEPTSLILITRSGDVAHFTAYRGADAQIKQEQFPDAVLKETRIFHTSCFALSREPARSAILAAAARAHRFNCQLSIDLNYAEEVWPDRDEAQSAVQTYCEKGALVKAGELDWIRLYERPFEDPEQAAAHFTAMGARQVCITLGNEGCLVASGKKTWKISARRIEIKDTTGAGDAFWSGYLTAWLDGRGEEQCAAAGTRMAEEKLKHFGPLPARVDRQLIYGP